LQLTRLKWNRIVPVVILLVALSGAVCWSEERAEPDVFPRYPCIEPNVDFWLKIYTRYSSDQGIIHDKRRMDRIYGIISLEDPYHAGGRRINRKRIKAAKKKYKAILAKLMKGKPPAGSQEKKVAEMFGPNAKPDEYRRAMYNLRCQTGQKDRFREGLIRSGAYIDEIRLIFRNANLPEDLAYLPHVESSFNPRAYSKFGAAGMWQFTRSTGKRFMQVGYTIDERRDPLLSSRAAAKLLRDNHRKLNNWPMAITAYNHGLTGMRRAQRKKGSYERVFKEYRSRLFRFASRNFYSEFLAAREAAKNYRHYFGELALNAPVETLEVELSGYVSLQEVARYLNVDLAELKELNPALRPPVFRGQKYVPRGYRLRLPDRDDRNWEQSIAQLPRELYRKNQKRSSIYTVRRGDTAGKIARTHGVKLDELIAVNNLDRRARIYVNQKLRIPLPEAKPIRIARLTGTKKNSAVMPSPAAKPMLAKQTTPSGEGAAPAGTDPIGNTDAVSAAVRETGAATVGVSTENSQSRPVKNFPHANQMLALLNTRDIGSDSRPDEQAAASETAATETGTVSPGAETPVLTVDAESDSSEPAVREAIQQGKPVEDLRIHENEIALIPPQLPQRAVPVIEAGETVAAETTAEPHNKVSATLSPPQPASPGANELKSHPEIVQGHFAVDRVSAQSGIQIGYIRVEAEETLGHYAEWLNVSATRIRRLNGFRYGRPLHLSQKIKIPLDRVTKDEFEEKRFEFHQELAEDFFASFRVEKVLTYSIKKGDNIWTLSRQEFEVPLWLIKRYNADVDFGALVPSQKLRIPVIEKNV
jgi:membrane-bound lytic murein transglycosylase D